MKTSELVLDFLRKQGFTPEVNPENGNIVFKYQMATYLFVNNDEDDEFFQLIMPAIYDVTDENRDIVLDAANKTNMKMKVCKTCILDDEVWLFFEILLDSTPDVSNIIPRALGILQGTRQEFYQNIE